MYFHVCLLDITAYGRFVSSYQTNIWHSLTLQPNIQHGPPTTLRPPTCCSRKYSSSSTLVVESTHVLLQCVRRSERWEGSLRTPNPTTHNIYSIICIVIPIPTYLSACALSMHNALPVLFTMLWHSFIDTLTSSFSNLHFHSDSDCDEHNRDIIGSGWCIMYPLYPPVYAASWKLWVSACISMSVTSKMSGLLSNTESWPGTSDAPV